MHFVHAIFGLLVANLACARPNMRQVRAHEVLPGLHEFDERQSFNFPPHCVPGVHIIAVGGLGVEDGGGPNRNSSYGLLNTTVIAIREQLPPTSNMSIQYPRSMTNYTGDALVGTQKLRENIQWYTNGCPDVPIVLLGYSFGAVVLMNLLCGRSHEGAPFSPPFAKRYAYNIIATIVFGDESRIPNQPYDRGNCTEGQGVNPRQNPAGCQHFADNIRSYCSIGDPECCGGTNENIHKEYPQIYNAKVAQYVKHRFESRIGSKLPITTTTTTTSTSSTSFPIPPITVSLPAAATGL